MSLDNYHFYAETVQANIMRVLIDNMGIFISDINFIIDETGIHSMVLDDSKVVMLCTDLEASKFNTFHCPKRLRVGLHIDYIQKALKAANGNNTVLRFFIEKKNSEKFGIFIAEAEKETSTETILDMITLDEDTYEMPNIEYSSIIVMSSQNLLQKVKIMALFTNTIEFVANKDGLYLQYGSQKMVNQKIFFKQSSNDSSEEGDNTSDDIKGIKYSEFKKEVSNTFSAKYILSVAKNSNLCNNLFIYIESGGTPLILEYFVGGLGKIKYCIAPKVVV